MAPSASFFVLPSRLTTQLFEAALPRPRQVTVKLLFFTRSKTVQEDSLRPFLETWGDEQARFGFSPFAITTLDRVLQRKGAPPIFRGTRLSQLHSTVELFEPRTAQALLAAIKAAGLQAKDVDALLQEATGSVDPVARDAVFAASRQLADWLAKVKGETVGVLVIS